MVLVFGISNSLIPLQAAETSAKVLEGVQWAGPDHYPRRSARQNGRGYRLRHLVPDLQQMVGRGL